MARKTTLRAIRGMHDLLPQDSGRWQMFEDRARAVLEGYGYQEMRTPLLEVSELFKRSIGEVTDIVEKEMYSFEDRGGDHLSLRPEGTASCVRAAIEPSRVSTSNTVSSMAGENPCNVARSISARSSPASIP